MVRLATLGLVLFLAAPAMVHAALIPARNVIAEVRATPEFPKPNETVRFTAGLLDGGLYTFVWTANGASLASGAGATTIVAKAGPPGSATEIMVTAVDAGGVVRGTGSFIMRPAEVDLVWEAKSYVPPLYDGLPLVNQGGRISIQAVPRVYQSGAPIPASQLAYAWSIDGKPFSAAAYGRPSIIVSPPYFDKSFTIAVRAQTPDGLNAAESRITIAPKKPLLVLYEDRPLVGIAFHDAVQGTAALGTDEITYRAYPVYADSLAGLTYRWLLNGQPVKADVADPRSATFRKERDASGSFTVGVSFANASRLFENAATKFTVAIQ